MSDKLRPVFLAFKGSQRILTGFLKAYFHEKVLDKMENSVRNICRFHKTGVYILPSILEAFPCPIWKSFPKRQKLSFFAFYFLFFVNHTSGICNFCIFPLLFSPFSSFFPLFLPFCPPLLKSFPRGEGGNTELYTTLPQNHWNISNLILSTYIILRYISYYFVCSRKVVVSSKGWRQ